MPIAPICEFAAVNLEKMQGMARLLAKLLVPADVLTLSGDLGAGKTSFARALIQSVAPEGTEVTSPTYTLMQSYDIMLTEGKALLWHLDLYRLKHEQELDELGLEEIWPHVSLIEWPEILEGRLPRERLDIIFTAGDSLETRRIAFFGNDAWRQRLAALT